MDWDFDSDSGGIGDCFTVEIDIGWQCHSSGLYLCLCKIKEM